MVTTEIHPSLTKRKIIHLDMDAFYASVEMRDNPEWRGKPLIVGGSPTGRGVVSTCSYEARKYGIHSAMPTAHAYRLCPHGIFIRPRFHAYKEASQAVRSIMRRFTEQIEPLSLDEAYLDVTECCSTGRTASSIASEMRETVARELNLSCSAGVAPNKMIAKIASDFRKPNGQTVVAPSQVLAFMQGLPIHKIPGVGPVTREKLERRGLHTCSDVWAREDEFKDHHGRFERWLWKRAQGIDERSVQTSWERKSIGHEETFSSDLVATEVLLQRLELIATQLRDRMRRSKVAGRTITLKVKYQDFKLITRSRTINDYICDEHAISAIAKHLLQKSEAGNRPVRLLGLALSNLRSTAHQTYQPSLFEGLVPHNN